MPMTPEANGRKATNAPLLASRLARATANLECKRAYCELVHARPTDGSIQAFAFGRARGVIEGVAGAFDIEVVFIAPPSWKKHAGVPAGKDHKDVARTRAIARWPGMAEQFERKCDVDRAEAALIGDCGLHRASAEVAP